MKKNLFLIMSVFLSSCNLNSSTTNEKVTEDSISKTTIHYLKTNKINYSKAEYFYDDKLDRTTIIYGDVGNQTIDIEDGYVCAEK